MGQIVEASTNAPAVVTPRQALAELLDRNKEAIGASLPTIGYSQERFTRLLLTAANTNPDLFECDPRSFLAAGVGAAQLGLEPNDARGLAYLLPFKDKRRGKIVQLIIGYRGMMDLARRSGMVTSINAFPVFRQDTFTYSLGLEPTLHHVPGAHDENPNDLTHVYAVAKVQGDPQFVVLTRKQVDKARKASRGADSTYSPWNTHYTEMALKTAIRRLCKYLPQTVEMAQAINSDERELTITDLGSIGYSGPDPDDVIDATSGEIRPASDVIDAEVVDEPVDLLASGE